MAEDEGVPINERRVGHLPGDRVRIEIGFFRHEMNLKEVFAAFEHEESHEPFEVTLRGCEVQQGHPLGHRSERRSSRPLSMPAVRGGNVRGRRIAFDSSTEETWRNWHLLVREEPAAPPSF